jgi:Flp pilus assembly protein CpaB
LTHQICKTLFAFLGLAAFASTLAAPIAGNQQTVETYKAVRRLPAEQNEPVTITAVTVKHQKIGLNEKFLATEDWLNGLTITLKNSSNNPILLTSVQLQFPRQEGDQGAIAVDDISYGNPALLAKPREASAASPILAPGLSADVSISSNDLERIKSLLSTGGYKGNIDVIAIRVGRTIFADDTMWYAGTNLRRDPSSPRNWVMY